MTSIRDEFLGALRGALEGIAEARYRGKNSWRKLLVLNVRKTNGTFEPKNYSSYVGRVFNDEINLSRELYQQIRSQVLDAEDLGRDAITAATLTKIDELFDRYEDYNLRVRSNPWRAVRSIHRWKAREYIQEQIDKRGMTLAQLKDDAAFIRFFKPMVVGRRQVGDFPGAIRYAKAMLKVLGENEMKLSQQQLLAYSAIVAKDGSYAAHQGKERDSVVHFSSELTQVLKKQSDGYALRWACMANVYLAKFLGSEQSQPAGYGIIAWQSYQEQVPSYLDREVFSSAHTGYVYRNEAAVELWRQGAELSDRPRPLNFRTLRSSFRTAISEAHNRRDFEAAAYCSISLARAELRENRIDIALSLLVKAEVDLYKHNLKSTLARARCLELIGQINNRIAAGSGNVHLEKSEEIYRNLGHSDESSRIVKLLTQD